MYHIYTISKIIWTFTILILWSRFHNRRKTFSQHPIHHPIAPNLYFIARVKTFIEKRSLVDFFEFLVKPLIFDAKELFGHFHYFVSRT